MDFRVIECTMLLLRDVAKSDLVGLKRLASVLNSVNLPNSEEVLCNLIEKSVKSFAGGITNPFQREYLFVLEDLRNHRIIGTSMVIAQHGTRESPHIYFQVSEVEHYSATLDRHFRHTVLSIANNYDGPTEIGGLIVDPRYRSGPNKPGKQLSYVRFLFMAMHRADFRDRILAELLPPLLPNGRSLFWEACGKKFTHLSYLEADKMSRQNKEFIKELFPTTDIYASLLPLRAQRSIAAVGADTRGVQHMLERIGFRYVDHVDPFDGGPHYEAATDDVSLMRHFRTATVSKRTLELQAQEFVVGTSRLTGNNRFRAVRSPVCFDDQQALLPRSVREQLKVKPGNTIALIPFE